MAEWNTKITPVISKAEEALIWLQGQYPNEPISMSSNADKILYLQMEQKTDTEMAAIMTQIQILFPGVF